MSGCLIRPRYEGICLVSLNLVLSCLAIILGDLLFSEKGGRGDLGERAYEGTRMSGRGGGSVVGIYCMRQELIFNKKEKTFKRYIYKNINFIPRVVMRVR